MTIDTRSERSVDIHASIAKAHDSGLSESEQKAVREHLAYILTKLIDPNSFIDPVKQALAILDMRRKWYEKPHGIVVIALVVAGLVYFLGWN